MATVKEKIPLIIALILCPLASLWAQAPGENPGANITTEDVLSASVRDFAIVGGTTGLGALIGASTLSFVDEPEDHLRRIIVGGSIGLILGVGIVAYFQATKGRDAYESYSSSHVGPDFGPREKLAWHRRHHRQLMAGQGSLSLLHHQFSF